MPTKVILIYGTWQKDGNRIIPDLLSSSAGGDWDVQTINGVGVPDEGRGGLLHPWPQRYLAYLHSIWTKYSDGALAYSMERKLQLAYAKMKGVEPNERVIVMGCSRGGFIAQMLAQQAERRESSDLTPGGSTPAQDRNLDLYVFDPVGTHGLWRGLLTLVGRSPVPKKFIGYDTKRLASCVRRARVVLMKDEDRLLFEPNVFSTVDDCDLQQIWFSGVHNDAWGPSMPALYVLAFVWQDLFGADNDTRGEQLKLYEDRLSEEFKTHWQELSQCNAQPRYPTFCIRRPRKREEGSPHWSISGAECDRSEREQHLYQRLDELRKMSMPDEHDVDHRDQV